MSDVENILKNLSQQRKNKKESMFKKDETPMIVKLHQMEKNNKSKGRKKK